MIQMVKRNMNTKSTRVEEYYVKCGLSYDDHEEGPFTSFDNARKEQIILDSCRGVKWSVILRRDASVAFPLVSKRIASRAMSASSDLNDAVTRGVDELIADGTLVFVGGRARLS
jgi:hypothetical protein